MSTALFDTTIGKTLKAALYLAASAVISYLISQIQGNPAMWGTYTPFVNIVLVALKGFADPTQRDYPSQPISKG